MFGRIVPGRRVPSATVAEVRRVAVKAIDTHDLFRDRRAVMVGVPGAFTPVCTEKHLPDFIRNADLLKSSGYDLVVCLAPNDPWTVDRWAREIDPERKIRFISDGNLEFSRKLALTEVRTDLYLGERTRRFLMLLNDGVVERVTVEPFVERLTCTRCEDVMV